MKFSITSLLTVTAFAAWLLAIVQMQADMRRIFVPLSFLSVIVILFVIAMVMPRSSTGTLDYEKNMLLDSLEPTFKLTFVLAAIAVLGLLFFACYAICSF